MITNRLGRAIKLCRTQRGLNQTELAQAAGISFSYLSLLERGKRDPTMSTIENLANALAVPVIMLIFLAEDDAGKAALSAELLEKLSYKTLQLIEGTS